MKSPRLAVVKRTEPVEDRTSILTMIRHAAPGLPPTARRIATHIERHAQDVIRMSITELAEHAGIDADTAERWRARIDEAAAVGVRVPLNPLEQERG